MRETQKKFLHDSVAEILSLPPNKVIWAYQNNMPRQRTPYVILRLWGLHGEAQEEIRPIIGGNDPGATLKNIVVPQAIILEVQYFAGTKCDIDPSHELQNLIRELETPPWADRFFVERIAVFDAENVRDLTMLIDNQTYEYRAVVELRVRFNSEIEKDLGQINEVNISGMDNNNSALIYGNIDKSGKVSDWSHSLPMEFEVKGG